MTDDGATISARAALLGRRRARVVVVFEVGDDGSTVTARVGATTFPPHGPARPLSLGGAPEALLSDAVGEIVEAVTRWEARP